MGIVSGIAKIAVGRAVMAAALSDKADREEEAERIEQSFPYTFFVRKEARLFSSRRCFEVTDSEDEMLFSFRVFPEEKRAYIRDQEDDEVAYLRKTHKTVDKWYGPVAHERYAVTLMASNGEKKVIGHIVPDYTNMVKSVAFDVDFNGWRIEGARFGHMRDVLDSRGCCVSRIVELGSDSYSVSYSDPGIGLMLVILVAVLELG